MPGLLDYLLWFLCMPLEAAVVVCAYRKGLLRKYFFLNVYMAASVVVGILRFETLHRYTLLSTQYAYVYYYTDALLTICLFLSLINLFSHVFGELNAEKYVRFGASVLLAGTALFSYGVVQQSESRLVTHFVVELSQDLYFVGLFLTYVLWAGILKLRETRTQLVQLVLSLGVYFSLFAANYASRNLFPSWGYVFQALPPLISCFLPLAWAYAFWRIPKEARLVPTELAVAPR